MCKYCEEHEYICDTRTKRSKKGEFIPGIEIDITNNELYVLAVADTYEPGVVDQTIKINYCPMCGRKLSDEQVKTNNTKFILNG